MEYNAGLRFEAALLAQNRGSVYTLDRFLPRGWEDTFLGAGTYFRFGTEATYPITYIDDGFLIAPLYFKALYAYGFAETTRGTAAQAERYASMGGGLALKFRFFYSVDLELRWGLAFRFDRDKPFRFVYR
jgi:hypothetical protein